MKDRWLGGQLTLPPNRWRYLSKHIVFVLLLLLELLRGASYENYRVKNGIHCYLKYLFLLSYHAFDNILSLVLPSTTGFQLFFLSLVYILLRIFRHLEKSYTRLLPLVYMSLSMRRLIYRHRTQSTFCHPIIITFK